MRVCICVSAGCITVRFLSVASDLLSLQRMGSVAHCQTASLNQLHLQVAVLLYTRELLAMNVLCLQ